MNPKRKAIPVDDFPTMPSPSRDFKKAEPLTQEDLRKPLNQSLILARLPGKTSAQDASALVKKNNGWVKFRFAYQDAAAGSVTAVPGFKFSVGATEVPSASIKPTDLVVTTYPGIPTGAEMAAGVAVVCNTTANDLIVTVSCAFQVIGFPSVANVTGIVAQTISSS